MTPVRMGILAVAVIAAVGLIFVLTTLVSRPKHGTAAITVEAKPSVRVLVAARDLPVGTRLMLADMTWQTWPADGVNTSYITDGEPPARQEVGAKGAAQTLVSGARTLMSGSSPKMQALQGSIVRDVLVKGEPIVKGKIVAPGEGGYMAVRLDPGMRAMSVPVNADTGAGGFIQPGDRVDVLEEHADNGPKSKGAPVTEAVVTNVRVLATDQSTDPSKNGKSSVASTLTLEIPAASVTALAAAKNGGKITVILRSYADMGGGPGGAVGGSGVRLVQGGEESLVSVAK